MTKTKVDDSIKAQIELHKEEQDQELAKTS